MPSVVQLFSSVTLGHILLSICSSLGRFTGLFLLCRQIDVTLSVQSMNRANASYPVNEVIISGDLHGDAAQLMFCCRLPEKTCRFRQQFS